jgi:hypothetical protein
MRRSGREERVRIGMDRWVRWRMMTRVGEGAMEQTEGLRGDEYKQDVPTAERFSRHQTYEIGY